MEIQKKAQDIESKIKACPAYVFCKERLGETSDSLCQDEGFSAIGSGKVLCFAWDIEVQLPEEVG